MLNPVSFILYQHCFKCAATSWMWLWNLSDKHHLACVVSYGTGMKWFPMWILFFKQYWTSASVTGTLAIRVLGWLFLAVHIRGGHWHKQKQDNYFIMSGLFGCSLGNKTASDVKNTDGKQMSGGQSQWQQCVGLRRTGIDNFKICFKGTESSNPKTRKSVPLILLPQKMCSYSKPERFHSQHVLKNEESDLSSCVNIKKNFRVHCYNQEIHIDLNFLA